MLLEMRNATCREARGGVSPESAYSLSLPGEGKSERIRTSEHPRYQPALLRPFSSHTCPLGASLGPKTGEPGSHAEASNKELVEQEPTDEPDDGVGQQQKSNAGA